MFVSFTFRITGLNYTYGCPSFSRAYVCKLYLQNYWVLKKFMGAPPKFQAYVCNLYLQNHWVTLNLWVRQLKCSLCFLALLTESLGYTTLMVASPTYRITWLHYSFWCATLSAAYVRKHYLLHHQVTLHLWVRHLK